MYVPDRYRVTDPEVIRAYVRDHPFATFVTTRDTKSDSTSDSGPRASHIPLLLRTEPDGNDVVIGHVAKANPQWRDFDGVRTALAIFDWGPHAYVSPRWYGAGNYVPTWNYASVQLRGIPQVITDPEQHRAALRGLTEQFEAPEGYSMDALPEDYLQAMVDATVAFQMPVLEVHAAQKLSQNRTPAIRASVAEHLETSPDTAAQGIAALMRQQLQPPA